MEKKNSTKKIIFIAFGLVFALGIFLRTYNFHDWLRFNADQARDATLSGQVIEGKANWPLLGPKAGGTNFKLGPAFYQLQIISGKIFGNLPDKLAYSDLFFSMLSIPLLFFLLRKYFDEKLAFALMSLYAVSFYVIKYARFAWNPNSTPFWTMLFLYALLQIFDCPTNKKRILWSVVAGVAVGVGVQLHTFLLVVMPLLTIGYFVYIGKKEKKMWQNFLLVFLVSIFLNIPQLHSEIQTGGENVKALFGGVAIKKEDKSFIMKAGRVSECFMTASTFTVSSLGESDQCEFSSFKTTGNIIDAVLGGLLFLGGLGLGIWRMMQESSEARKRFLGLILAYTGLMIIFMFPVAYELSLRYFLIIAFLPFVFLGLWLEFLLQKFKKKGWFASLAIIIILAGVNLWTTANNFIAIGDYTKKTSMAGFDNVYLGELELMANYIVTQSNPSTKVLLDGNSQYLFKASRGLIYLTEKKGIDLQVLNNKNKVAGNIVFYLIDTKSRDKQSEKLKTSYDILDFQSFGRFGLIKARIKN
jgi:4-amino-4-deoxy-L-arabinose transferase-like glycosyltransferase